MVIIIIISVIIIIILLLCEEERERKYLYPSGENKSNTPIHKYSLGKKTSTTK